MTDGRKIIRNSNDRSTSLNSSLRYSYPLDKSLGILREKVLASHASIAAAGPSCYTGMEHVKASISDSCHGNLSLDTIRWAFVETSLFLLHALDLAHANEQKTTVDDTSAVIGVRHQRYMMTLLEVVICWGIYPGFLPGIGIPLPCRVRSGYVRNHPRKPCTSMRQSTKTIR